MGFFSWKTNDTNRSINNRFCGKSTFTVILMDDKGGEWCEDFYEGYGDFGGKDFYQLLAEMNGFSDRLEGTALAFGETSRADRGEILWPNLVEDPEWRWRNVAPKDCPVQGYFYDEESQ